MVDKSTVYDTKNHLKTESHPYFTLYYDSNYFSYMVMLKQLHRQIENILFVWCII